MLNNKTVIIAGAGASNEVGLPVGDGLKDRIRELLDISFEHYSHQTSGDSQIVDAFKTAARLDTSLENNSHDINPYINAARRISSAMPQAISIDNYIDNHAGDSLIELCGKIAIVRSILEAECNSQLFIDVRAGETQINFPKIQQTWYTRFFQVLTENCRVNDLPERLSNICFIVFNYDRCIEHFLVCALQNFYPIDERKAVDLVSQIEIYHPYGQVGLLPWQQTNGSIGFGGGVNGQGLLSLASQIRTFTQGIDPTSRIKQIRNRLAESEMILFLGFAFHRLNMKLLKQNSLLDVFSLEKGKRIFATAQGISEYDCKSILKDISDLGLDIQLPIELRNDLSCHELFKGYGRTLSQAWI